MDRKQKIKLGIMLSSLVIAILEDCSRRAELLPWPGFDLGPHWRGVQTPPLGPPPPGVEVAERGALSGLFVSEILMWSVEKEDCTQWRSGCSDSNSVCDL